ncbi:ABC transporter permease [Hydrogenophilus islandicus]
MIGEAFLQAVALIRAWDAALAEIVQLSLVVSGSALFFGAIIGIPCGAILGALRFPGRGLLIALLQSLLGVPSVVVGVVVFLLFSRAGPLGFLGWLYDPAGMVVAQTLLVAPLTAAITRQVVEHAAERLRDELTMMRLAWLPRLGWLVYDCRFSLLLALFSGFARAASEVGAVMIVGGNIEGATRVMTTAIALETAKGDLTLALALGIVLVGLVALIHLAASGLEALARRRVAG